MNSVPKSAAGDRQGTDCKRHATDQGDRVMKDLVVVVLGIWLRVFVLLIVECGTKSEKRED